MLLETGVAVVKLLSTEAVVEKLFEHFQQTVFAGFRLKAEQHLLNGHVGTFQILKKAPLAHRKIRKIIFNFFLFFYFSTYQRFSLHLTVRLVQHFRIHFIRHLIPHLIRRYGLQFGMALLGEVTRWRGEPFIADNADYHYAFLIAD